MNIKMQKISAANRKFFLEWLPFNFCDRFCERCEEFQDDCKIYQDDVNFKVKCQIEGKDSHDMKVIFEHVAETMTQTMKLVQEMIKKEGVKITKEDEKRADKFERAAAAAVVKNMLFKKCRLISRKFARFFENFSYPLCNEQVLLYLYNEMQELCFYCHLIFVKAARALHSRIEEKKDKDDFSRPDPLVSAALGYYFLLVCKRSIEVILNLIGHGAIQAKQIVKIIKLAEEAKSEFEKAFPGVTEFRDKIIFHGKV